MAVAAGFRIQTVETPVEGIAAANIIWVLSMILL